MTTSLPAFEGREVRKSQLKITKTGDGLSEALAMIPKPWHAGDEIYLVLRAEVTQINHRTEKDTEDLIRVHTAEAREVTEVFAGDVKAFLESAAETLRVARDAAAGQEQLPMATPDQRPSLKVEPDLEPVAGGGAGLGAESEFDPNDLPDHDAQAALDEKPSRKVPV